MRIAAPLIFLCVFALAALAPGPKPPAVLSYSGADIADGPGTMTVRCTQGELGLWELDLTRDKNRRDLIITRFDDLTDTWDFSYANPATNHYPFFLAHERSRLNDDTFTELHKGPDLYEFSLREASGNCLVAVTCRIGPATAEGTRITVTRTAVNASGRPLGQNLAVSASMGAQLALNVGEFNGRADSGKCTFTAPDSDGRRRLKLPGGQDALYETTDNCERKNPKFDAKGYLWCQATVLNSAAARKLGLVPGRTFRIDSDIVAYYPADSIGGITFDSRAPYMDALVLSLTPNEWLGQSREDHNVVGIPVDGTAIKTFTLSINICAEK